MSKIKVAAFIVIAQFSKLLMHLFLMKKIAEYYGPSGLGFLSGFISLITLSITLSGGGIISGIIKYTSEYAEEKKRQEEFISSALIYTLVSSLLVVLLGILFANQLSEYIFLDSQHKGYIYFFLVIQILIGLNTFVIGVCNGLKKTYLYSLLVFVGNIIVLGLVFYVIPLFGYWGAIIAIAATAFSSIIPAFILLVFYGRKWSFKLRFVKIVEDSKLLAKYSMMLFFTALCFPVVEILIRNKIASQLDLTTAGYWQALMRFSVSYTSFFALFVSFYFVPIVSALQDQKKLIQEVKHMVLFITLTFIPIFIIVYFLKNYLIICLFSKDFLAISDLLLPQMFGDFFRVLGWIVGAIFVAKANTRLYILNELMQGVLFFILSCVFLSYYNSINGVVVAYTTACIVCSSVLFLALLGGPKIKNLLGSIKLSVSD